MRGFYAFFKKECMENLKNHRLLILAAVFLIFGMMNAPFAKYTPEILATFADGFTVNVAPSAIDSWTQFFKNASGLGMSIVIILFGSTLATEYSKGTLVLLVTKGLPRAAILLAKYFVAVLVMSGCYWLSFLATYGYTAYYWPDNNLSRIVPAAAALWTLGFLYLALLMLGGVLFRQTFSAILFTGAIVAVLSLVNTFGFLEHINPIRLSIDNLALIEGTVALSDMTAPVLMSLALTIVSLCAAVKIFAHKSL